MKLFLKNIGLKISRNIPIISLIVLLFAVTLSLFVSCMLSSIKTDIYENERISQSKTYQSILDSMISNIEIEIDLENIDPFNSNELKTMYNSYLSSYNYINKNTSIYLFYRDTLADNHTELKVIMNDTEYTVVQIIDENQNNALAFLKVNDYNNIIKEFDTDNQFNFLYDPNKIIDLYKLKTLFPYEYDLITNSEMILTDWCYFDKNFVDRINSLIPTQYADNNYIDNGVCQYNYNISVLPTHGFYSNPDESADRILRKLCFVIVNDEKNISSVIGDSIEEICHIEHIFLAVICIMSLVTLIMGFFSSYLFKFIKNNLSND